MLEIKTIPSDEILKYLPLLQELRPNIDEQKFTEIYQQAHKADDYNFYGYFEDQKCVGLLGARILEDYVHLKHLYIDDLIVTNSHRSKGVGAKLLKFAEELAREKNCTGLRLCTGVDNKDGIRFYERESWVARALAFKKKI